MILYAPLHFSEYGREVCFCDLETTGLDPEMGEILEFGAVKIKDGKIIQTFNTLVKPSIPITEEITKINGITNEMVADAPKIREALQNFLYFVGNNVIIGHNWIAFDEKWIRNNTQFWFGKSFWNRRLDTLIMAQKVLKPKMLHGRVLNKYPKSEEHPDGYVVENNRLNPTLVNYFGIDPGNAHRAVDDSIACFKVFIELEKLMLPHFAEQIQDYYYPKQEIVF